MDWSKLPDIVAVGLLASAFASVARRSYTRTAGLWLTGWLLIVLHFTSFVFLPAPQWWGELADLVGDFFLLGAQGVGLKLRIAAFFIRLQPRIHQVGRGDALHARGLADSFGIFADELWVQHSGRTVYIGIVKREVRHLPVMVQEVMAALKLREGMVVVASARFQLRLQLHC